MVRGCCHCTTVEVEFSAKKYSCTLVNEFQTFSQISCWYHDLAQCELRRSCFPKVKAVCVCMWVILQAMKNKRSLIMEWKTEKRNPLVTTALQKDFPTSVLRSYTHLGAKSLIKPHSNSNKYSHNIMNYDELSDCTPNVSKNVQSGILNTYSRNF